uniref:Zinc/iron permease n=1 Tax=Panagrellus redivivus TaxID=6233 RepID=A0A7E4VGM8_PANRE
MAANNLNLSAIAASWMGDLHDHDHDHASHEHDHEHLFQFDPSDETDSSGINLGTMEAVILQICLAAAMFLTTAATGLIPLKLIRSLTNKQSVESRRVSWILTLLSCFGGGVFIGTCFLDIFPHVKGNFVKFQKLSGWHTDFPVPEFMACLGFFMVYFLEEVSLKIFTEGHAHHGHGGADTDDKRGRTASVTDATTAFVNGMPRGSMDGSDKYLAAKTHEIVMDESMRYVSDDNAESGVLKSIMFAVVMSLHSILEGFALGVQDDNTGIITLFISLIIHKGIESFSVGLQISRANSKRTLMVVSTILVYALMTPIGSLLGVGLFNLSIDAVYKEGLVVVLEGLAGGTFIYVTFFEVLAQERANDHSNLVQLAAIVAGFAVISTIQITEHLSGGHGHAHG